MGSSGEVGDIILFDGVCNLCSGAVQFVIRRDTRNRFRFAALQSEAGTSLLKRHGSAPSLESIILVRGDQLFSQSDAALEIVRRLPGAWPLLYSLKIVPRFFRDAIYRSIASRRYAWFGRQASCMVPTPALRAKFLD